MALLKKGFDRTITPLISPDRIKMYDEGILSAYDLNTELKLQEKKEKKKAILTAAKEKVNLRLIEGITEEIDKAETK